MLPSLDRLADQFRRLPAVGRKSAVRMAFAALDWSNEEVTDFLNALTEARSNIRRCPVCMGLCEGELCDICADPDRDPSVICVVEDYQSQLAFEKVKEYRGLYHVLHGVLSPIDGIGPDQLCIAELAARVADKNTDSPVREVIIATNPTVEGEATAMYLTKLLKPFGITISRLAYGMPVGSDLEYTDALTLGRAMEGRREI